MRAARIAMWALVFVMGAAAQAQGLAPRLVHVISDLHFGIGAPKTTFKTPVGLPCVATPIAISDMANPDWLRTEDFRWPVALCGFLQNVGGEPQGAIIVIAGDFLELWQHPQKQCIQDAQPNCGCTVQEMKEELLPRVLDAHKRELDMFAAFLARNPRNQLVVVPGNHDAALMHDEVWSVLAERIPAGPNQLVRVETGTWISDDRQIVVEHGHQQTLPDVNAFPRWSERKVTQQCADGKERFYAPWGEHFVAKLYTPVEFEHFPLIDNLVPDSLGVATYYAWAKQQKVAVQNIARFVYFNVFETSWRQKVEVLEVGPGGAMIDADVKACVACIGQDELVLRDARRTPQTAAFLQSQAVPEGELRAAMAEERRRMLGSADLPFESQRALCQREALANVGQAGGKWKPTKADGSLCPETLSTIKAKLEDPTGSQMLAQRVNELVKLTADNVGVYVFGHTHEAKRRMQVDLPTRSIAAFNTGAFHRQVDQAHFDRMKAAGETDVDLLKRLKHEDLKACYSVVTITPGLVGPSAKLRQWSQREDEAAGRFIEDACSDECSSKPANCPMAGARSEQ